MITSKGHRVLTIPLLLAGIVPILLPKESKYELVIFVVEACVGC